MPQLIGTLRGERGSVLVATIAFAIIMAIAGSGLLMLAANSVNREADAIQDDRARLAAESGLRIGLRWFADSTNWADNSTAGLPDFYTCVIDGITVTDSLGIENGYPVIYSRATSTDMHYCKVLSCVTERDLAASRVFFDTLDNVNGLGNIWFDGPFHSNKPLLVNPADHVKRGDVYFINGPVSVTNTAADRWDYGDGPSGNNYDYGIGFFTGDPSGQQIDTHFDNTFTHSQDSLFWPQGLTPGPPEILLTKITSGPRPLLCFYVDPSSNKGMAQYYSGTNYANSSPEFEIDNRIIKAENDVSIIGVVKGRTTIVTDPGCSIYPVGKLVYSDFDSLIAYQHDNFMNNANYGVPMGSTNMLALVSGADIYFDNSMYYNFDRTLKKLVNPTILGHVDYIYITAVLIATAPGHGLTWASGSMNWINQYNYRLRVIGSRIIYKHFDYTAGGYTTNYMIRFFFDTRLSRNISAPGLPGLRRRSWVNGAPFDLYLLKTVWREKNIPK